MMCGKQGENLDAISIPNLLLLFRTLRGVDYSYLQPGYEAYAQRFGIEIVDSEERTKYLQKQLGELPSFRQSELVDIQHKKKQAEKEWYGIVLEKVKCNIYTQ